MNRTLSKIREVHFDPALAGLCVSVILPSIGVLNKYFHMRGAVAYIVTISMLLIFGNQYFFARIINRITEKQARWLGAGFIIVLTLLFMLIYPLANSGIIGPGSDRDEAMNIAVTEILHGRYPYYPKTYFGNPISPMPGSLFLAVPFVLLGNSAYQNIFWLIVFLISMSVYLRNSRSALFYLLVVFALSPVVMQEFVTGGDLLANSLYVSILFLWMLIVIPQPNIHLWIKIGLALLTGIALSSRANFIFLLPIFFSSLVQRVGWKSAARYIAVTCLALISVTLPFFLYDPQGFSPLHTVGKLAQFQTILPYSGILIPFFTGLLALVLSFRRIGTGLTVFFENCFIVLAFPVICGIILQWGATNGTNITFADFGLAFLFFGITAYWPKLTKNAIVGSGNVSMI